MWHAKFNNGDQEFVAIGDNRNDMDVYRIAANEAVNGLPRCHVHVGGQLILISTADEDAREPATRPHSQIGIDHIGLRVEDMDEAAAELKDA